MRFYGILILIAGTNVSSAPIVQCIAGQNVSWSYNHETKLSAFFENSENLSNIFINFDTGFIKVSDNLESPSTLFRQTAISKSINDPLDIVVRYEKTSEAEIKTGSVIITDPMCRNDNAVYVSIFDTSNMSFKNTIYTCECLSSVHYSSNFISME